MKTVFYEYMNFLSFYLKIQLLAFYAVLVKGTIQKLQPERKEGLSQFLFLVLFQRVL